jgi:hypothetical protein
MLHSSSDDDVECESDITGVCAVNAVIAWFVLMYWVISSDNTDMLSSPWSVLTFFFSGDWNEPDFGIW